MSNAKHDRLKQDLDELKLNYIAEHYRELLDEAARKNTSALDVLIQLTPHPARSSRRLFAAKPQIARILRLQACASL